MKDKFASVNRDTKAELKALGNETYTVTIVTATDHEDIATGLSLGMAEKLAAENPGAVYFVEDCDAE